MPLVSMEQMMNDAQKGGYAIGQFNLNGLEFAQAFLEAAEEEQTPMILGVTEKAAYSMGGFQLIAAMVNALLEHYKTSVPIALHLDHSASFEACVQAMRAGFTSVMIDGSHLPLQSNLQLTCKVVEAAQALGVSVEAELGRISGEEDGVVLDDAAATYATAEECGKFIRETGVTVLAPALGTVHGLFKALPNLRFDLIAELAQQTQAALALHGGSGVPVQEIRKAVALGITKINVNTEMQIAYSAALRKILSEQPQFYESRSYLTSAGEAVKAVTRSKMREFGRGQAKIAIN